MSTPLDPCGLPEGVFHEHNGRCFRGGERAATKRAAAAIDALAANMERRAMSDRADQRAASGEEAEYWAGCADTRFAEIDELRDLARHLRANPNEVAP